MSLPYVTTVAPNDYSVSIETGNGPARLNLYRYDDNAPNAFGGRGVSIPHPVHDGLRFETSEDASWYAFEHGYLGLWRVGSEKLAEPYFAERVDTIEVAR